MDKIYQDIGETMARQVGRKKEPPRLKNLPWRRALFSNFHASQRRLSIEKTESLRIPLLRQVEEGEEGTSFNRLSKLWNMRSNFFGALRLLCTLPLAWKGSRTLRRVRLTASSWPYYLFWTGSGWGNHSYLRVNSFRAGGRELLSFLPWAGLWACPISPLGWPSKLP